MGNNEKAKKLILEHPEWSNEKISKEANVSRQACERISKKLEIENNFFRPVYRIGIDGKYRYINGIKKSLNLNDKKLIMSNQKIGLSNGDKIDAVIFKMAKKNEEQNVKITENSKKESKKINEYIKRIKCCLDETNRLLKKIEFLSNND